MHPWLYWNNSKGNLTSGPTSLLLAYWNIWDTQRNFCITLLQEQVLSAALDKIETKYTRVNQGCILQPHKTRTGEEGKKPKFPLTYQSNDHPYSNKHQSSGQHDINSRGYGLQPFKTYRVKTPVAKVRLQVTVKSTSSTQNRPRTLAAIYKTASSKRCTLSRVNSVTKSSQNQKTLSEGIFLLFYTML